MGKKQEKKTQSNSLQGKRNHGASRDLHKQQQNQQSKIATNQKLLPTANGRAQQGEERKTEEEIQVRKARFSFKIEVLKTSTSNCPRTEISKLLAEC